MRENRGPQSDRAVRTDRNRLRMELIYVNILANPDVRSYVDAAASMQEGAQSKSSRHEEGEFREESLTEFTHDAKHCCSQPLNMLDLSRRLHDLRQTLVVSCHCFLDICLCMGERNEGGFELGGGDVHPVAEHARSVLREQRIFQRRVEPIVPPPEREVKRPLKGLGNNNADKH